MPTRSKFSHDPYAALRSRHYRLNLVTGFFNVLTSQMIAMAVFWDIYGKTQSALDLGLVGLTQIAPFLVLGLLAGSLADRYDRRLIASISGLVNAVGLVLLAMISTHRDSFHHFNLWFFGCLLFLGTAAAFYVPARQSLLPQLVPRKDLANAVSWGSGMFQVASVAGPALCGWILERFPSSVVYISGVISAMVAAIATLTFPKQKENTHAKTVTLKSLGDGARFVWKNKPILATITLDLFAVLLGGCTALMPIFVKDILHSGPQTMGWLLTAPSLGAFGMSLFWAHRPPMKHPGKSLLGAVAGFGAATMVFGLSKNLWLSLAMMFVVGALDNISVIVRGTLVQVLTPGHLLGRVQSVNFIFINSSNYLGAFESGVVAAFIGAVPSVVLGGLGSILIVLGVTWLWPEVARLGPLHKVSAKNQ